MVGHEVEKLDETFKILADCQALFLNELENIWLTGGGGDLSFRIPARSTAR